MITWIAEVAPGVVLACNASWRVSAREALRIAAFDLQLPPPGEVVALRPPAVHHADMPSHGWTPVAVGAVGSAPACGIEGNPYYAGTLDVYGVCQGCQTYRRYERLRAAEEQLVRGDLPACHPNYIDVD